MTGRGAPALGAPASAASNEVTVTVGSGTSEKCTNGADDDGDGLIDCADSDCRRNRACR